MGDSTKKTNSKKFKLLKLRVFGSLSSIPRSFRKRGSQDSDLSSNASLDNIFEKVQDDLTTTPRSPSYARSSDMYSHMGTMPRFNKMSSKSKKEKSRPPPSTMSHSTNDLLDKDHSEMIVVPSLMSQRKSLKVQGSQLSVISVPNSENEDILDKARPEIMADHCGPLALSGCSLDPPPTTMADDDTKVAADNGNQAPGSSDERYSVVFKKQLLVGEDLHFDTDFTPFLHSFCFFYW
ncbi:uncharacterized protein PAF06_000353 [Gastrophryne carolinensis]